MRLISAFVRNYRVHQELRVTFDGSRMLIGGPNECGKSTLIEAIHRGLFLRAKVTGEVLKRMESTTFPGTPEVELVFEAGGQRYQLNKRFGGPGGTTRLVATGGAPWLGEDAETRLAALLGVNAMGGGRGASDRILQQWSHLWVWQGFGGNDPTEYANANHNSLLQRLQQAGGAAAMQSALDTSVAARFALATESIFARGRAKAGSELERAETAFESAGVALGSARERLERLRHAVDDYTDAADILVRTERDLHTLNVQLEAALAKQTRLGDLRSQESSQSSASNSASESLSTLERADAKIVGVRETIARLETELAPKDDAVRRLSESYEEARRQADLGVREYEAGCESTRSQRCRHDLASAWLGEFEKTARFDELAKKAEQVRELESELTRLREDLAKLPAVDGPKLRKIQKLELELGGAKAGLEAMAARVDIVTSDQPILLGGLPLSSGESRILTEDTEVRIGGGICIRVRPGGGTSLAEARQKSSDAHHALQKALSGCGVASVGEATEVAGRRIDLTTRINATEATLEGLDAANLNLALTDARSARAAAEAEVERRLAQVSDLLRPASIVEGRATAVAESQRLQEAEANERRRKMARDAAAGVVTQSEELLRSSRQNLEKQNRAVEDLRAQLRLLIESHGGDTDRSRALADARAAHVAASETLAGTRLAIAALEPDLLVADLGRLQRAKIQLERTAVEAETKRAVAQAALHSDGTDDPEAAVALASSQADSAGEHLASVRRKAAAIQLLHDLFLEKQRALSDRFTRPLANKISQYLQCLFGAGARANVALVENSFSGLQLIRASHGGAAVAFDSLSGGAREQVAAATRLARACPRNRDFGRGTLAGA